MKEKSGKEPSTTAFSDSVASCKVSGGTVTITMGKDLTTADFFVDILNSAPLLQSDSKINGNLKNFGTKVQLMNVVD